MLRGNKPWPYVAAGALGYGTKRAYNYARKPAAKKARTYSARSYVNSCVKALKEKKIVANQCGRSGVDSAFTTMPTAHFPQINSGTSAHERIGNELVVESIHIQGEVACAIQQITEGDMYGMSLRAVLVHDKRPGATAPTFADVFGWTDANGTLQTEFRSPVRSEVDSRFRVVKERILSFNPPANSTVAGGTINLRRPIDLYAKVNAKTSFSGTTDDLSDIDTGAFYFYLIRTNSTTTSLSVSGCYARIKYRDRV